jgi:divalent metal cation (Fe/Co/Zn/Cd) transporter
MIISIIITFILVSFLNRVAKKTGDMVVKSDAVHYKTDLFSNFGILV